MPVLHFVGTVGHKSHDPSSHAILMGKGVMTFAALCTVCARAVESASPLPPPPTISSVMDVTGKYCIRPDCSMRYFSRKFGPKQTRANFDFENTNYLIYPQF